MPDPFRPPIPVRAWAAIGLFALALGALVGWSIWSARMPGEPFTGAPPPATPAERALADALARDVRVLATEIGERNERRHRALTEACEYLERRLRGDGLAPRRESYEVRGRRVHNVIADVGPAGRPALLVGAHYDSAIGSPGANDNASGVAVLLALAARLHARPPARRVRFAFFTLEEPPHFGRATMGSRVYAREAAARGDLPERAIVFDSVGYFTSAQDTQRYSVFWQSLVFGERGDFLALVADDASEPLLREAIGVLRASARFRSEGAVLSRRARGAAWSDHASFWAHDVPAILVTDTAAFRDPHYHQPTDDGAQIDHLALARITAAMEPVVRRLAR